jgi:RND family efflux transporter MFP subunit
MPIFLTACDDSKPTAAKAPTPKVEIAEAVTAKVPLMREFVGTTAAIKLVEVRARVQGYLQERPFTEGADVKKGEVLFVIDQRPFQADIQKAAAELEQNQAELTFAQEQADRYKTLYSDNVTSAQNYETVQRQALEAAGAVKASEAALTNAQLDLEYSTITAPIDGRISNTQVSIGNLVSAENTLLTTLVQLDPIYAYFNPSEAVYDEIAAHQAEEPLKVSMILANGAAHAHQGTIDFVDNRVDPDTGTIKMRAVVPNPDKTQRPGQYVKVQLELGEDDDAILVPAPAVAADEAGHHVFVLDKDDKVERRNVKLGTAFKDQYVIDDGVKAGERVVVKGLQKVRAGEQVEVTQAATAKTDESGEASKSN